MIRDRHDEGKVLLIVVGGGGSFPERKENLVNVGHGSRFDPLLEANGKEAKQH